MGTRCSGKGKAYYIEAYSDSEEDEDYQDQEQGETIETVVEGQDLGGTIATMTGVPRFHTLQIKGTIQGHRVGVLIDGGASHNFIDVAWVKRRGIQTESFDGFSVAATGHTMECSQRIPKLKVTLGNYTVIETFYVVDVTDMNVVLGVQWLYSIGKYSTNYQTMEMEFTGAKG